MIIPILIFSVEKSEIDKEINQRENELNNKKTQISNLQKEIKELKKQERALKANRKMTSRQRNIKLAKLRQLIKDKTYVKNNLEWWIRRGEGVENTLAEKNKESENTQSNFTTLKKAYEKEFIDLFLLNVPCKDNENIRNEILLKALMAYQEDLIFNLDTSYLKTKKEIAHNQTRLSKINSKIDSKQKKKDELEDKYSEYKKQTDALENRINSLSSEERRVLKNRKKLIENKEKLEKEAEELENFIDDLVNSKQGIKKEKLVSRIDIIQPCNGAIVKEYGEKLNRLSKVTTKGIEYRVVAGSPVKAVFAGQVIYSGYLKAKGQMIIVDHLNGFISVYANNSRLNAHVGDSVKIGEVIAKSGTDSQGEPSLYFELRKGSKAVNPKLYFKR